MGEENLINMMLGKPNSHMQKNQTGLLSHTIHKNKLKMDSRLKYKTWNHKTPRRKHRQDAL